MNFEHFFGGSHQSQEEAFQEDSFRELDATQLYCPKCRQAVPVRKRLLLVLPEGDKYEYLCAFCSGSVGTKLDRNGPPRGVIV